MIEQVNQQQPNEMKRSVCVQSTGRRRLATITVERPRCPHCGGVRLRKYRTLFDQGDGSALWWVQCISDDCGHRFRVVLE